MVLPWPYTCTLMALIINSFKSPIIHFVWKLSLGDIIGNDSWNSSDFELMQSPFIQDHTVSTLDDVLQKHKRNLGMSGTQRIGIDRADLWGESVAVFKNPNFIVLSAPRVKFAGEGGIDGGGLSKEFGSLLRTAMFSPEANLFEGIEDRKMPIFTIQGIQSRLFQLSGKMVSYLIVHLDIGIPFLSPPIYYYIAHGSLEGAANLCSLDDVCDYEIQELITKVLLWQLKSFFSIMFPLVYHFTRGLSYILNLSGASLNKI